VAEFFKRTSSRKFLAFLATQALLAVLAFTHPELAESSIWAMVATFGGYAGAQGLVDRARAGIVQAPPDDAP